MSIVTTSSPLVADDPMVAGSVGERVPLTTPEGRTISICTGLPRPRWRGRVHTWAFAVAIPAALVLVRLADGGPATRLGVAVFGVSLAAVFGVSAAYHRLARSPAAQRLMRRIDHSMIFVFIAGTYTAVGTVSLSPVALGVLMVVVWTIAAAGIVAKVNGSGRLFTLSNWLYLAICGPWLIVMPAFVGSVPPGPLVLMLFGGACYGLGAIVFYRASPDPDPDVFGFHEIWHVATVLGGASHVAMVAALT